LLGSSIRITNDARFRTEAANLASAMVAEMWTMTAAQMDTQFGSGGAKLTDWQTKASSLLPSAATYPPTVDLTQPGLSPESRTVVVTVFWQLPGETEKHRYLMTAQIGKERTVKTPMRRNPRAQAGVGLMEVMISIVISMLLVLVIYQVYEISEGQKRTITAGSDAQQNASYSMYVLGRDLSMAGNGIASAADSLDTCTQFRPLPVMIQPGAERQRPRHDHGVLWRIELSVHVNPL
jgi:Tfp pilus assembly protein PilV